MDSTKPGVLKSISSPARKPVRKIANPLQADGVSKRSWIIVAQEQAAYDKEFVEAGGKL